MVAPATILLSPTSAQVYGQYSNVRTLTEKLCQPLEIEDYGIQSMADVSPPKWHLAHTTWFFETFILMSYLPGYQVFHPQFGYLFNSYYEAMGERHPRAERGLLSRPTVAEVYAYRAHVDQAMAQLLDQADCQQWQKLEPLIILGIHHEQQHQELLLMDIKHIFATNPLRPIYHDQITTSQQQAPEQQWLDYPEGIYQLGEHTSEFSFDNERPRHRIFLEPYRLASRLVTNAEYLAFMRAGGYHTPEYWLAEGWFVAQQASWHAPLYWEQDGHNWQVMTLAGMQPLHLDQPVCHISYYEADAYARWAEKRLPTEAEWEAAFTLMPLTGNLLESGRLHPAVAQGAGLTQGFGDVWEWTQSAYTAYPGYRPDPGALGEYNGKFMCNQFVLRGGSCVTSASHLRPSYRNFFPPAARWQFSGLRLADTGS